MNQILDSVLDEFGKLAAIPRPSKHEAAVSNFLRDYLTEIGVTVAQDLHNNIIADIPATAGHEAAPLTILQAHMDMVCVAENGYDYNPLTDSIKLVRTDKFLEAEGTSLGADDGIGIAEIIYIIKNRGSITHGPIRAIFTVDEEQGMSGARNLDAKYLIDADYLINCDSEVFGELIVGSAGNVHIDFARQVNYVEANENFRTAIRIRISGLSGGHSGIDIAKIRGNAVKVMANFLREIRGAGNFQLASFNAGTAPNVIPSVAEVVIVTNLMEMDVAEVGAKFGERVRKIYGEENFKVEIALAQRPNKVMSTGDFESLANLVGVIHSGAYMVKGANPVSSANLGIVRTGDEIVVKTLARSNISEMIGEFIESFAQIGRITGFETEIGTPSPAWDYNPDSRITEIMAKVFERKNGVPAKINTSHGGLECSFFVAKNPRLDIVSTGTTNEHIHSPNERLHLETVTPHVLMIVDTLAQIARG